MAVVTLAVGVPQLDMVGKQNGASYKRDVGVHEEEVVGKQDGADFNRPYGGSEEDVVGKQDGTAWISIGRWP